MKILFAITRAERGGAQVHVASLLKGLCKRHEVFLAVGEEGYLCGATRELNVPVHIVGDLCQPISPLRDARALGSLVSLVKRVNPDFIHAHSSKAGLVARLAGAVTHTRVIYTAHGWAFGEGMPRGQGIICRSLERFCAPLSEKIITVSDATRRAATSNGVGLSQQMTTVWNGVPDTEWRARPGVGGLPRLVMVARFAPPKDQALLLKALATIRRDFQIIFVGDGPSLAVARGLATGLGLGGKVVFLGDRGDVEEILATAHGLVLSSKSEGLPLVILEAMRAGLPVIASDVGGVAEAVQQGHTGLLVPAQDEGALRSAIETLLTDVSLRRRLGRNGRLRYERDFTYETMLSKTESIYAEVLGAVSLTDSGLRVANGIVPQAVAESIH
jgi:glycosyltransferase involved in cell wall biosynthesis